MRSSSRHREGHSACLPVSFYQRLKGVEIRTGVLKAFQVDSEELHDHETAIMG